jgi:surface antigen
VFGKADPDAAGTGHVAFCVGIDGDSVLVLGGNQRDAVTIASRPKSRIVSVRWPLLS